MNEYCIANDEGVIEDGFISREEALAALADRYNEDDDACVQLRSNYDADGQRLEDEEID